MENNSEGNVAQQNIEIAQTILLNNNIKILGKDIGGQMWRKIIFNPVSTQITIYKDNDPEMLASHMNGNFFI